MVQPHWHTQKERISHLRELLMSVTIVVMSRTGAWIPAFGHCLPVQVGNTHAFNRNPVPIFLQSLGLVPAVIWRPAVSVDKEVTNDNVISYVYEWLLASVYVREIWTLILAVVKAQCG